MMTYHSETLKNKILFIAILAALLSSCSRQDGGYAPSQSINTGIEISEVTPIETVTSGNLQVSGTTEEVVEKKISGNVTIEGALSE